MKKLLPIIVGVIVGIVSSMGMINYRQSYVAEGAINLWDEAVAYGDLFEWKDIFTPSERPQNIYKLVYSKLFVVPEREAINQLAKNYGYTSDEIQRILGGSLSVIFRNPGRKGVILTQEQAYDVYQTIQDDFANYQEIFDIEQEINVAIAPSEIFANGDLSDSGFDLIHDLSVIEEILFVEVEANTVGDPFHLGLESPFVPTKAELDQFAEIGSGPADDDDDDDDDRVIREEGEGDEESREDQIEEEEDPFDANHLDKDVCVDESDLAQALDDFEEEQKAQEEADSDDDQDDQDLDLGLGAQTGLGGEDDEEPESLVNEEGEISPPPAGTWGSAFCPGVTDVGADGAASAAGSTFGQAGFSSLGDTINSLINQAAIAAAGVDYPGFSADVSICLDTDLKWKRVKSYIPGQSCVACEVDDINDLLNKTLSHSLVPNKATGNIFESAKCKQTLTVPLVDMNFIALGVPIPTPPSDDLIFGRNMFEEWNKFVDRYEPFFGLRPQYSEDFLVEFELETAPPDTTVSDQLNSVIAIRQKQVSEAMNSLENYHYSHDGKNAMLYSQVVLGEMKQMTAFFEHIKELYEDIDVKACQELIEKENIN